MSGHKGAGRRGWTYHPLELAFCGYSGSGKSTLLAKLVPALGLDLAFIKHDVHKFTMDHPGKDTHTLKAAGAQTVFISNQTNQALLRSVPADPFLQGLDFLSCDAAVVEGHKRSALPKILVLDAELAIVQDEAFREEAPLAAVGPWPQAPVLPWTVPYFQRDDVDGLAAFVKARWDSLVAVRPLYGLVLTGGQSQRMGRDKALLDYHGQAQADRAFELLSGVCQQVWVSCRADQQDWPGRVGRPQILDSFSGLGPLSGILSAQTADPEAAWLVVACDLPYLDRETLDRLKAGRQPYRFATAFLGADGLPEPLCAIYEPKARARLLQFLAMGYDCPRKMLINSPIGRLDLAEAQALDNINEPQDYERARHDLRC